MNESLVTNITTYAQILKEASTSHVATWKPFFVERCTQWCIQIESELAALSTQEVNLYRQEAMTRCAVTIPESEQLLDAKHELYKALIKNIYLNNELYWTVVASYDFFALATSPRHANLIQDISESAQEAATVDVLDAMMCVLPASLVSEPPIGSNTKRILCPFSRLFNMTASSSWADSGALYTFFHQLCFLLTGLATTLGTQWIFYAGAATGDSYLTQLAQYVGAIMVGLLIPIILARQNKQYTSVATDDDDDPNRISMDVLDDEDEKPVVHTESASKISDGPIQHKSIMKLALLDVVANFCVTLGFSVIGSGMYQVIYSSVVIWCAILTYFFMGRTLSKLQWVAIFGTSAGLALSSFGSFGTPDKDHGLGKLTTGTLLTMAGTFGYSCFYVYSDHILSKQIPPPLPARVCFTSGLYCTALSLIWISVYTLPKFDSLIHVDPNVTSASVWGVYAIVTVANATHSWNYYELIDRTGNVATGILQGLRAILVYILSHVWFCATDSAQCFTAYKGCGSVLVIGCVLLFTVGGGGRKQK